MEIKRYKILTIDWEFGDHIEQDNNGKYVLYEDIAKYISQQAVKRKKPKLPSLKTVIKEVCSKIDDDKTYNALQMPTMVSQLTYNAIKKLGNFG